MKRYKRSIVLSVVATLWLCGASRAAEEPAAGGVAVAYQLPTDGPLPQPYRVTLAITDVQNPDWLINQFVAGEVRTVTAENRGRFTESWNGLDDNFMPVPPGTYGVKGIYLPAQKWAIDGEYHSITPRFLSAPSAFQPTPEQTTVAEPFHGDPCGQPLGDVDVGLNGIAVFYYVYLENGLNNPLIDLKKPGIGHDLFLRAFGSGGAAGGECTATDGETVWSFSTDGGPKYVYRADAKPFGTGRGQRPNVYRPEGWVKAMSAWRDATAGKSYVYIAQGGRIVGSEESRRFREDPAQPVDTITVHAGDGGAVLAEMPVRSPRGLVTRRGTLRVLHQLADGGGWAVSTVSLANGVPQGTLQKLFALSAEIQPFDLEEDSQGRFYVSDPRANQVYQFAPDGRPLRTFGRLDRQEPGRYDRETFMAPGKLATRLDPDGHDRLLVVEHAGPNRVSEWSADGKLLREFPSLQTKANDGYAVDPADASLIYIAGHQGWLTRFKVDYDTGAWTVDAVWPDVGSDPLAPDFDHPKFVRVNGQAYLACARSFNVYRQAGDRWLLSAAIIRKRVANRQECWLWHDANGDGKVQEDEYRDTPVELPGWVLRYHGEQWLDDLSLVAINQRGPDVWRLAPTSFDQHQNPVFTRWEKLLTDPVFEARLAGTADAVHGGNELDTKFSSDWAMTDGSMAEGFYVNARGGPSFSANEGGQVKISRYMPDGKGGYALKWRTGRKALQNVARSGEIYATIHIVKPINGLLSVVDQSRCGVLLYTEDGLYVESIFPDGRRFPRAVAGVYPQPGEFFAGNVYSNPANGRIYFAMGKYTPQLFAAEGWSLKENPVRPLKTVDGQVTITAGQIAAPLEIALTMRGGAGAAKLARFAPALGGAVLDGSLTSWESCEPIAFAADKDQKVEVRCLYDPENLYLRWHARLSTPFVPKVLQPVERMFTHDRGADTLSFYVQGDLNAKPGGPVGGRSGDVRLVFGVFQDGEAVKSVALGLYPKWHGEGRASPLTYRTPVGKVEFAHVAPVADVKLNHVLDKDGKGFVLTAAIPRRVIPGLPPFSGELRTMVNFEATFGGHNKFWWANADGSASRETYDEPTEARLYPGSWVPAQFQGVGDGVVVRNWLICGPFGGLGAENFSADPHGEVKDAVKKFCAAAVYPPDVDPLDVRAEYTGDLVQGYWRNPGKVRWKASTIADLDTRVILGGGAQVWYGATWVKAPAETEAEFRFQGHPMTFYRWTLNGQKLLDGEIKGKRKEAETEKTVTLQAGWNQVLFRGFCVGYPPFRAGLVIAAAPEKLWTLRLAATPPTP